MNAFCASENFDAFIALRSIPSQGFYSGKLHLKARNFSGSRSGTVALGGLIRETYTDNESGLPLLKDIPGIGYAFKSRDITKRRTELIIFLTPRIIRTDEDAQNAIHFIRRGMDRLGAQDTPVN
jgi:hypothetical protein